MSESDVFTVQQRILKMLDTGDAYWNSGELSSAARVYSDAFDVCEGLSERPNLTDAQKKWLSDICAYLFDRIQAIDHKNHAKDAQTPLDTGGVSSVPQHAKEPEAAPVAAVAPPRRSAAAPKAEAKKSVEGTKMSGEELVDFAKSIIGEKPTTTWDDIAGLETAKTSLREALVFPRLQRDLYKGGRHPWKAILLYGPPGTGKTILGKALANDAKCTFIFVKIASILDMYVGNAEKRVEAIFEIARATAPVLLFFDEVDALCESRANQGRSNTGKVLNTLLSLMDDPGKDVFVLGTTNVPWDIDDAMKRRFEKKIYVPLPDEGARAVIMANNLKTVKNNVSDEFIQQVARTSLRGFSGADISMMTKSAMMMPVSHLMNSVKFFCLAPDTSENKGRYVPCDEDTPGAVPSNSPVLANRLAVPVVTEKHVRDALKGSHRTSSDAIIAEYDKYKG